MAARLPFNYFVAAELWLWVHGPSPTHIQSAASLKRGESLGGHWASTASARPYPAASQHPGRAWTTPVVVVAPLRFPARSPARHSVEPERKDISNVTQTRCASAALAEHVDRPDLARCGLPRVRPSPQEPPQGMRQRGAAGAVIPLRRAGTALARCEATDHGCRGLDATHLFCET